MASRDSDPWLVGRANEKLLNRSSTAIAVIASMAGLAAIGVVVGSAWLFLDQLGNSDADYALQFAGTSGRLRDRSADLAAMGETFSVSDARLTQLWGIAFAVVWGTVGYLLFAIFWRHCWNAGLAAGRGVVRSIRFLPLIGAVFAVLERIVTLVSIREAADGTVELISAMPAIIVALAWAKWVLGGLTLLSVLALVVAAFARAAQTPLPTEWTERFEAHRKQGMSYREAERAADAITEHPVADVSIAHDVGDLAQAPITSIRLDAPTEDKLSKPDGTGVCCSGGGIRAASFALGCLSALERTPEPNDLPASILGRAKYLASVSGGGYAAAAWRIAAGQDTLPSAPLIGDPTQFTSDVEPFPRADLPSPDLLTHIRQRRSFLANGRGGLPRALLRFMVQTALHLFLIFAVVFVLAWPFGKLLGSWAVDALVVDDSGLRTNIGRHQWLPPLVTLAPIIPMAFGRMMLHRVRLRQNLDRGIAGLVALAAGSALVLLVLPYAVELIVEVAPHADQRALLSGIWAVVVTAIWQFTKRYVKRNLQYLGGLFLAGGLAIFAAFTIDWSLIDQNPLGRWPMFVSIAVFLLIGFIMFNPDMWSLHDFYRQRLTGTFSTRRLDDGTLIGRVDPPALHEYAGAGGPSPIVCCAAARQYQADTGIAALSMTFEPQAVTLYQWMQRENSQLAQLRPAQISHTDFTRLLPNSGERLSSLMGAAAISGAAVAPAMGRKNMASTNALLAAFNARLGVWVPNPAHAGQRTIDREVSPRLINMFKEIFGVYDPKDPNVYATDGGHWDNLGLVELIRRRCSTIIAVDTSGDLPGTYQALKEATELALFECGARVHFDDSEWANLVPDEDGLVAENHMVGTVTYRDGHEARLLYVKGAVARTSSLAILRYAAGDPTFPNYSTGNQMLTDRQLTFLVRLGDEAMRRALELHPSIVTAALLPDQRTIDEWVDDPDREWVS